MRPPLRIAALLLVMVLAVVLVLAIARGGPARFDGSNEESVRSSLARMIVGLTPAEKGALADDIRVVILVEGITLGYPKRFRTEEGAPRIHVELYRPLNGLTAAEIHRKAEALRRQLVEPDPPEPPEPE